MLLKNILSISKFLNKKSRESKKETKTKKRKFEFHSIKIKS